MAPAPTQPLSKDGGAGLLSPLGGTGGRRASAANLLQEKYNVKVWRRSTASRGSRQREWQLHVQRSAEACPFRSPLMPPERLTACLCIRCACGRAPAGHPGV